MTGQASFPQMSGNGGHYLAGIVASLNFFNQRAVRGWVLLDDLKALG